MKAKHLLLGAAISGLTVGSMANASTFTEALTGGKASGDIRIRYESVENDNTDSDQISVRTRLGYKTGEISGFSAFMEFEDVTDLMGKDDENGLIPDPEVTEVDQGFIQYKAKMVTAKLGRQVITLDGHRHIGHVGWRQDRQTFDAFRVMVNPTEDLTIDLSHIYQRNRIFGESADAHSNDYLVNIGYKTPIGKIVGYSYMLDDELRDEQSDTFGASLNGSAKAGEAKILYAVELATQEITDAGVEYETDYSLLELGVSIAGVTAKAGVETLGSDEGMASFTTPLATLHKFNGWADIFLGGTFDPSAMSNGLEDSYVSVATKQFGTKFVLAYHDYSADEGGDDYGSEINFVVAKKFGKNYNAGFKYAAYSDDGYNAAGDVDKIWLWVGAKF